MLVYYIVGLISVEDMLGNFVNPALISLMLLIMVGFVLEKTTIIRFVTKHLFSNGLSRSIARMGVFVGSSSAILNNTAVVSSLLSSAGKNSKHPPSKFLIPLSYIAIFGGTLTLIGTSTHLIINGFVVQAGLPQLGMFDFIYVGGIILLVGTLSLMIMAPKILPAIKQHQVEQAEFFIESKLKQGSPLIGKSILDAGLRHLEDIYLVQVVSGGRVYSPVSPQYILKADDRLMFVGDINASTKLLLLPGVELAGSVKEDDVENVVEVVLSHESSLIGKTLKKANFRNKFNAAVIAIRRGSEKLNGRLAEIKLKAGDTLILVTGSDFEKRDNLQRNFYFYSKVEIGQQLSARRSAVVGLGFLAVIGLAALEIVPLVKGLMILLAVFLVTRFVTATELRRRIPFDLYLTIGSSLGIAMVMMDTGTASLLAEAIMWVFSGWGLWGALIGVYLATVLLTELITNNASAALGFPIAVAVSEMMGVSVWPFIMVVAYGASASFMTPYGYQTNLMVYGPGGYKFVDYLQIGMPISIIYGLIVILCVPIFFPF